MTVVNGQGVPITVDNNIMCDNDGFIDVFMEFNDVVVIDFC